jgi:hypothetical protein
MAAESWRRAALRSEDYLWNDRKTLSCSLEATDDIDMVIEIFNRIDGKVKDRLELGGEDGEPIRVERIDAKQFTDEELELYEELIKKASTKKHE